MSIIFNQKLKSLARFILSQRVLINNPIYKKYYNNRMNKLMSEMIVKPDRVRLENTNVCNAKCKFCPHPEMKRKQGYMSMKLFKKLARQIKDWGVKEIVIQGFGEPLADPYFFQRVKYCGKIGIPKIQTNINSRWITRRIANYLLRSDLKEIFISCNPLGEENVKYLLNRRNSTYPKIYLSFIKGQTKTYSNIKKADGVSVSYPHNWGGAFSGVSTPKTPCRLLWATMYITYDGYSHLCCMDTEADYDYGNVAENTLQELWARHPYRKLHLAKEWEAIPICKGCDYNSHNKSPWWIR